MNISEKAIQEKWYYEFNRYTSFSKQGSYSVKQGEVGSPICVIPLPDFGGTNPKERAEALAKLIASAPEMLGLLKEIKERGHELVGASSLHSKIDLLIQKFI